MRHDTEGGQPGLVPHYLAERYWPGATPAQLAEAGIRARAAAGAQHIHPVEYLGASWVVADEVLFCRYAAETAGAVEDASRRAGLAFDRILEYREVPPAERT